MTGIVVVGAGQVGSALVSKLRSLGFDGSLTLIGSEPAPPYQRPPLSKLDLSRFCAAPGARLSHFSFECDRAFPAQC